MGFRFTSQFQGIVFILFSDLKEKEFKFQGHFHFAYLSLLFKSKLCSLKINIKRLSVQTNLQNPFHSFFLQCLLDKKRL